MNEKNLPNKFIYSLLIIAIIFFVGIAEVVTLHEVKDKTIASLDYVEKANANYRVYYKDNPFYQEPYIEENKTYIAEYVKKIDFNLAYLVNYTDKLSGMYDYIVNAKMYVHTPGDESNDLWTKKYKIDNISTISFKNDPSYSVNKNITIDYQQYKNEYEEYRRMSNITTEAKLILELIVNNQGKYQKLDDFSHQASLIVEIPLSSPTFKITTLSNVTDETKTLTKTEKASQKRLFYKVLSVILWSTVAGLSLFLISLFHHNQKKISAYEKNLKKILTNYDSIIVNVAKLPKTSGLSVVDVISFDELVDAQNEVRLPINFKEDKKKHIAKFVLVQNNLAWVYTLKESSENEK